MTDRRDLADRISFRYVEDALFGVQEIVRGVATMKLDGSLPGEVRYESWWIKDHDDEFVRAAFEAAALQHFSEVLYA